MEKRPVIVHLSWALLALSALAGLGMVCLFVSGEGNLIDEMLCAIVQLASLAGLCLLALFRDSKNSATPPS